MNRGKREKSKINRQRERKGKQGVLLKDKETVGGRGRRERGGAGARGSIC